LIPLENLEWGPLVELAGHFAAASSEKRQKTLNKLFLNALLVRFGYAIMVGEDKSLMIGG
jgi:hypothetical protein